MNALFIGSLLTLVTAAPFDDKAASIEVTRVRVDAARELVLEAAPCKKNRRALQVVTLTDGAVRSAATPLGKDVACKAAMKVVNGKNELGAANADREDGEARVSAESFRLTAERNAIMVDHYEGFEFVDVTSMLLDAGPPAARPPPVDAGPDAASATAKPKQLAGNASHWHMGGIAFAFTPVPSASGDHDELIVVDASHGSDSADFRAEQLRWDANGKVSRTQLPVYALIYKSVDITDARWPEIERDCAPFGTSQFATSGWPLLAKGKVIVAEMFTSEAEAKKALRKAKECAPDAYVKRAR